MRRKVIIAAVVVLLAAGGFVGYLLSRDERQYYLSQGALATIGGTDTTILENSSSEDVALPRLKSGDEIRIVDDPSDDTTDRMRKVSVAVESGEFKGLTGKVARIYIRPKSWW
jgi:hypothetical protein